MRGDFRAGKRLNIKKIIPYIASSYKRDKIWMRRAIPSKRSYQVMLAIDDSESMTERESKNLAFDTLALVAKGMAMLEVGEVCVVGFGEEINVAHDFGLPYTSEAGAEILRQFTFAQSKTDVRKLLQESISLFREARMRATGSASDLWQVQLIISDGECEDHASIRQLVRQAHEERIMVVFIIVDSAARNTTGSTKQSILDLSRAEFVKDANGEAQLKMTKYLDTFPFQYYLIVRDVLELPGVLAGALRQWFAEVVEAGG
jgi:midasin